MLDITMRDVFDAVIFFIPAYSANFFACLLGGGKPLDFGRNFVDGKRILGDGVTLRGSLLGILAGVVVGLASSKAISLAFLLSLGAITGDACGSFIKRRLGIARGRPAPLLDQLNFVVGGLCFASLVVEISIKTVIILFLLTPFCHLLVNMTGYYLRLKEVPW